MAHGMAPPVKRCAAMGQAWGCFVVKTASFTGKVSPISIQQSTTAILASAKVLKDLLQRFSWTRPTKMKRPDGACMIVAHLNIVFPLSKYSRLKSDMNRLH